MIFMFPPEHEPRGDRPNNQSTTILYNFFLVLGFQEGHMSCAKKSKNFNQQKKSQFVLFCIPPLGALPSGLTVLRVVLRLCLHIKSCSPAAGIIFWVDLDPHVHPNLTFQRSSTPKQVFRTLRVLWRVLSLGIHYVSRFSVKNKYFQYMGYVSRFSGNTFARFPTLVPTNTINIAC